jgi:iron complex outermembrane receptor protein
MIYSSHASAQVNNPLRTVAQTQGPQSEATVGEVVVTAQRRSESLEKTSLSISVISPVALARSGITNITDISRISPGVVIGTATAAPQIYIRGVGDFAATGINNPAVALNVDGVYIARPDSIAADFYDLQRVEVLKGPQGTLYGRNASGGAINLITVLPKLNEYSGTLSTEFGNYSAVTTDAALNVPIGDTFAVRVAGNYVRRDGFTTEGFGGASQEAIRARALWKPSGTVSLLLDFSAGHVGGSGPASVIAGLGKFVDAVSPQGQAFLYSQIPTGGFGIGPDLRSQITLPGPNDRGYNNHYLNVSAQLDVDLGFANLTVIPAYRRATDQYVSDPWLRVAFGGNFLIQTNPNAPPSASNERAISGPETSDAKSLEVRLSKETNRLKWVLGAYYYNEQQFTLYNTAFPPLQNEGLIGNLSTKALAEFGQATYSLTHSFRVIGGIRYTSDQRELNGGTYAQPFSDFGFGPPPAFNPIQGPPFAVLVEKYAGQKTFTDVSWKAGVEYDVAENSMFYATASTGFKAGGFNQLSTQQAPGVSTAFRPEKLTAFDVGLKNRLFGNRLQLNVGGFYWDYRNQQVDRFGVNSAGGIGIEFVNAQQATIYGGNADFIAKLWQGATLNGGVEYAYGYYNKFVIESFNYLPGSSGCLVTPSGQIGPSGPAVYLNCSGHPTSRTPKWSGSVGLSQEIDVGYGRVTLSGDTTFASSRELSFDYILASHAPGYAVFNASIGYAPPNNQFSVLLFMRNITNRQVLTAGAEPSFAPGTFVGQVELPRTYGVRLGVKF